MKVVIQRVKKANVTVKNNVVGEIDQGLVALVGIGEADTEKDVDVVVDKMINLRIFEDQDGKMNLSLIDTSGSVLSISQFTLYGDVRKGRRPNFTKAKRPNEAEQLYEYFNEKVKEQNIKLETGKFGEMMDVSLINDGPVTIVIETEEGKIV